MAQESRLARGSDELERWQSLLRVSTDDQSGDTLVETLHRVVEAARDLLGCRYAVLGVVDDTGALEHLVPAGADPRKIKPIGRRPLRDGVLGAVVVDSRTIRLPGPGVDARSIGLPADHPVASSLLGVPIRSQGRTVGALYLSQPEDDRPFTPADEEAAGLVAAAAATAIHRAREADQRAHRRRWADEAAGLTRRLLAEVHDEPLRLLVERVHEVAGADLVTIVGQREDGGYDIRDAAGAVAGAVRGQVVESTRSVAVEVIQDATPRVYADLVTHFPGSVVVERMPFDTALVVPFNGPELGRGAIVLLRGAGRPVFTQAELEAITEFAAQISVALELVRTRDLRGELAVHEERDRIARDLHDHVIQRLFAIGLAVQSVGAGLDGEAGRRLIAGVDDIDATIAQIRSTIYQLTGPVLAAEDSLRERVVQLIAEMEPVLGFRAELELHGPTDFGLDTDLADDCVAVLREALTNVARHARASRAWAAVSVSPDTVTVEVRDDGRGIGATARRSGLANLRVRAERRGGRLTISSERGSGTTLSWRAPVGAAAAVRSAG